MEIMNMALIELEVDFIPLLVGAAFNAYSTSALADTCFWFSGDLMAV